MAMRLHTGMPRRGNPYQLNQAVTDNTASVSTAIAGLVLGSGSDGPEDYTRPFYESYADPSVGWRAGAKRIVVNFGDNAPHDNDLNEDVTTTATWPTGGDPGRDEIILNADDLDLQTVLAAMAANNITLIEAHSADWTTPSGLSVLDYWNYWTGITGGTTLLTASGSLVDDVVAAVTAALTTPDVTGLHLEASSPYESWLTSVAPPSYSGPTGVSVSFDITLTVPPGTAPGDYTFTINAVDEDNVVYGQQEVTIHVPQNLFGKMTGGGNIVTAGGRYSYGLETMVSPDGAVGHVEYNDHEQRAAFHSKTIDSVVLSDGPGIDPGNPIAAFDTAVIMGTGIWKNYLLLLKRWLPMPGNLAPTIPLRSR